MTPEDLSEARANVIERAINIETLLDAIISQHYIGRVTRKFLFEVLYDEYFNFGLKVKIFSQITSEQSWVHKLNRLASIRNHFVHRGRLTVDFERGEEPFVPDPKNVAKSIDFDGLYTEFGKLADALETFLFEHYTRAGGQLIDEPAAGGRKVIRAEEE
jgi:hypothetical protein